MLGIPYMGSKRKLATRILADITNRHPEATDFYDMCGGGGAVSFSAIKYYPHLAVHYNELNSHIYCLVEYLKTHKELDPKFYKWVTREMFFEQCGRTDADWYSGFVMSCWSFGNNSEKGYMYGAHLEGSKRLAHQVVVYGCKKSMSELGLDIPWLSSIKDINERRIAFCNYLDDNKHTLQYSNLVHLARLQNLSYLQNLQNLQNLQCTNLSYEMVQITGNNPVLYLDVPYKGTGEYKEGGFDHDKFYQWFATTQRPAYMSEYDAPFERVSAFGHRSSLSATNNKKQTIEGLFWNGKGNPLTNRFF